MKNLEVTSTGIQHKQELIPWASVRKIAKPLLCSHIRLYHKKGSLALAASEAELKNFIQMFFSTWHANEKERATKAAFDYVDQNKAFYKVVLLISVFTSVVLSVVMYNDSRTQLQCTAALRAGAQVMNADVLKMKKNRDGYFTYDLSFTAPSGKLIKGRDNLFINESDVPPTKTVPVLVANSQPECWSIRKENDNSVFAKRNLFTKMIALFAATFFVAGIIGTIFSILKLRETRPAIAEVKALFNF